MFFLMMGLRTDSYYDSLSPKPAIFFTERFMAARRGEGF